MKRSFVLTAAGLLLAAAGAAWFFASRAAKDADPERAPSFIEFMNEGHARLHAGNAGAAVNAFRRALELEPDSLPARFNLGLSWFLNMNAEEAARALEPLARSRPGYEPSVQVLYVYGLALNGTERQADAVPPLEAARQRDPAEVGIVFQLAVALLGSGKSAEAEKLLLEVLERDPLHIAASYRLSVIAARARRLEDRERFMALYDRNKAILGEDALAKETRGLNRYTRPLDPPLAFAAPLASPRRRGYATAPLDIVADASKRAPCAPAVLARDADLGAALVAAEGPAGFTVFIRNAGGGLASERQAEALGTPRYMGSTAADYDNDGLSDVLFFAPTGVALARQTEADRFVNATVAAGLAEAVAADAAFVDFDHDGDADLVLVRPEGTLAFYRNRGDKTFADETAQVVLPPLGGVVRVVAAELNDDDAIDLALATTTGAAILWNDGGDSFDGKSMPMWTAKGGAAAVAVDDIDNDGRIDAAFLERREGGNWRVGFADPAMAPVPIGDVEGRDLKLADFDGDGFLDLVVATTRGLRLFRNAGRAGFTEATAEQAVAEPPNDFDGARLRLSCPDLNADGLPEFLLARPERAPLVYWSAAESPVQAIAFRLRGTRSNRDGLGVRFDLRFGAARIFRLAQGGLTTIALGSFTKVDVASSIWPNGVTDALQNIGAGARREWIEPLVALGSCPYLYVHDGERMRFVTDILGNAPLGLTLKKGAVLPADTDEIVRLPFAKATTADGRASIIAEITDELREILYLDDVKLIAVDRAPGTEVHPTDRLMPPPFPKSEVWAVEDVRPPARAERDDGSDATESLARSDGRRIGPKTLREPQLRGLAEPHVLTLDFGAIDAALPLVLVAEGWLQYGDAGVNLAASQNPQLGPPFPRLEVEDSAGAWRPVDVVFGAPAGKTKTILVDLAGKLPAGARRLRIANASEIWWDRIALARRAAAPATRMVAPRLAELRSRGVSRLERSRTDEPLQPVYDAVEKPRWSGAIEGRCTRYGDVRPLLERVDDRYVVFNTGDALRLEFDVAALPLPAPGCEREWFLFTDGWDKDADHNVRSGDTVEPWPVHGQDDQTYGRIPSPLAGADWILAWNTRFIAAKTLGCPDDMDGAMLDMISMSTMALPPERSGAAVEKK